MYKDLIKEFISGLYFIGRMSGLAAIVFILFVAAFPGPIQDVHPDKISLIVLLLSVAIIGGLLSLTLKITLSKIFVIVIFTAITFYWMLIHNMITI